MKKLFAFALALVMLMSLISCSQKTSFKDISPDDTFDFSDYLDGVNFVSGLSQGTFVENMEQYSYNGQAPLGVYYDGPNGGGYAARGEKFGYVNDYDSGIYTNSLYTKVPLDGLKMPAGISFDDSIKEVLKKIANGKDVSFEFVADENCEWEMTLNSTEKGTLKVTNCSHSPKADSLEEYEYILTYKETYELSERFPVTRSVSMHFGVESEKLEYFRLSVTEDHTKSHPTFTTENDKSYLILPISGKKVKFSEDIENFRSAIDIDLLTDAEEKITKGVAQYSESPDFYIQDRDGKLFLCAEIIVPLDPPVTEVYEGEVIIVEDHDHKFFSEVITK